MLKNRIIMRYFNENNLFNGDNKSTLFFNHNNVHWNTKEKDFSRILEIIILELKIIDVKYLQMQENREKSNNADKIIKERNKLKIFYQAKKIGEELLNENKDIFISEKAPSLGDLLKTNFYILKNKTNKFIDIILIPLLKLVENGKFYKWIKLENKTGLWRELKDDESMPIGSEVSMNFKTGKNMLKL
tara:strand:- start:6718 stop:7281 length:564 start_codon:yes stop_codon:yes gene_type:complete